MGLRKIKGDLIKKVRNERRFKTIIQNSPVKFSRQSLFYWEKGKTVPSEENIIALCQALGCTYEDISVEVTGQNAAA